MMMSKCSLKPLFISPPKKALHHHHHHRRHRSIDCKTPDMLMTAIAQHTKKTERKMELIMIETIAIRRYEKLGVVAVFVVSPREEQWVLNIYVSNVQTYNLCYPHTRQPLAFLPSTARCVWTNCQLWHQIKEMISLARSAILQFRHP
jgi:hypothetical protein